MSGVRSRALELGRGQGCSLGDGWTVPLGTLWTSRGRRTIRRTGWPGFLGWWWDQPGELPGCISP